MFSRFNALILMLVLGLVCCIEDEAVPNDPVPNDAELETRSYQQSSDLLKVASTLERLSSMLKKKAAKQLPAYSVDAYQAMQSSPAAPSYETSYQATTAAPSYPAYYYHKRPETAAEVPVPAAPAYSPAAVSASLQTYSAVPTSAPYASVPTPAPYAPVPTPAPYAPVPTPAPYASVPSPAYPAPLSSPVYASIPTPFTPSPTSPAYSPSYAQLVQGPTQEYVQVPSGSYPRKVQAGTESGQLPYTYPRYLQRAPRPGSLYFDSEKD